MVEGVTDEQLSEAALAANQAQLDKVVELPDPDREDKIGALAGAIGSVWPAFLAAWPWDHPESVGDAYVSITPKILDALQAEGWTLVQDG